MKLENPLYRHLADSLYVDVKGDHMTGDLTSDGSISVCPNFTYYISNPCSFGGIGEFKVKRDVTY